METGESRRLVLFDEALARALDFAKRHFSEFPSAPLLVRDIYGRLRIAIDDRQSPLNPSALDGLAAALDKELGSYSLGPTAEDAFLFGSRLYDPDNVFSSQDAALVPEASGIRLLERQVTGQDWLRAPLPASKGAKRATLYGIKGGVGRSTALAIWAKALAEQHNKRVLVVDLDLESPGCSSMLLPAGRAPEYGFVDYLIEEAVGQGDAVIGRVSAVSPLVDSSRGEVLVVPAYGTTAGDYVAKLSRVYQGTSDGLVDFSSRACAALARLEAEIQPDVILLDSRAGLHDIAAMAITRMQALALLFFINTPQTFDAYRLLFDSFRRHPQKLSSFRDNLQAVGALVPDTGRTGYMHSLTTRLHGLFASYIYETEPEEYEKSAGEVWNFSLDDEEAPHHPIPIHWYRWFLDFDPVGNPEALKQSEVQAAFSSFIEQATQLLLGL